MFLQCYNTAISTANEPTVKEAIRRKIYIQYQGHLLHIVSTFRVYGGAVATDVWCIVIKRCNVPNTRKRKNEQANKLKSEQSAKGQRGDFYT